MVQQETHEWHSIRNSHGTRKKQQQIARKPNIIKENPLKSSEIFDIFKWAHFSLNQTIFQGKIEFSALNFSSKEENEEKLKDNCAISNYN